MNENARKYLQSSVDKLKQAYQIVLNNRVNEIAKTNIQNGKLYDNIVYISKLMEKSISKKNDPNFNYLLGKSYFLQGQGNYENALKYFSKIDKKDEDELNS